MIINSNILPIKNGHSWKNLIYVLNKLFNTAINKITSQSVKLFGKKQWHCLKILELSNCLFYLLDCNNIGCNGSKYLSKI